MAPKDQSLEVTVVFTDHGEANLTKYQYQIKSTGSFGSWIDTTDGVSNTGGTFTIGGLTNGTEYTVKVRGRSASLRVGAESDEASGTPDAPPAVSSIAITSTPTTAKTYIISEDIVVTFTFDKNITLSGTGSAPYIENKHWSGNQGNQLHSWELTNQGFVCTHDVAESETDADGIDFGSGDIQVTQILIVGPLGQPANLDHSGLAADSDHKVDGIRPTLSRADADPNDLTKIILTFSEKIKDAVRTKITVKKGGTTQTTTGTAAIDLATQRTVTLTLDTALLSTDTNITVDLAAEAVKDLPGNGNAEDLATSVSLEDNVAPTFVSAGTNGTDEVVLTYDEALNTTQPATSAFTVKVGGSNRGVDTVAISAAPSRSRSPRRSAPGTR